MTILSNLIEYMEKKQAERKAIEKRHAPTNTTTINYSSTVSYTHLTLPTKRIV